MFADRTEAGERLAERLDEQGIGTDVVLGIPRGALPVARPVADRLGAPLDVLVASKLGAPDNPELAIGAVAADGSVWLNEELIERLEVVTTYVDRVETEELRNAREKIERYRGDEALPDLDGDRAVIVDDGLATGATAIACVRQARSAGAERIVLAVPVASPDAADRLRPEVDELIALETPADFRAVGYHYEDFGQVTDEQALEYL